MVRFGVWLILVVAMMSLGATASYGELTEPQISDITILADLVGSKAFITYTFTASAQEGCVDEVSLVIPPLSQQTTLFTPGNQAQLSITDSTAVITFTHCVVSQEVYLKISSTAPITYSTGFMQYVLTSPFDQVISQHTVLLPSWAEESVILSVFPQSYQYIDFDLPRITWTNTESNNFVLQLEDRGANIPWAIIFAVFIVVLVGAGVGFFAYQRYWLPIRHERHVRTLLARCEVLQEKEQQVMKEIIQHPGIYQHTLLKKLDLLKSNGSKLVSKLENRGLIERKRLGKVNALHPGERLQ